MGLFGKKDPCPICGGKPKGLFPTKIEGQALCKACSIIDLPNGAVDHMTVAAFRDYMAFRKENDQLRAQFQSTQEVSLGFLSDRFYFDMSNRLMCRNDSSWVTIFEAKQIKSFVIREDANILFEGSANGLICYTSNVPQRVDAMGGMIMQARMQEEMRRAAEREGKDTVRYRHNLPEPFEKFYVEIRFDHPYWSVMTTERGGPTFNDSYPSSSDYLRDYNNMVMELDKLARALMDLAFPGAPEQRVGQYGMGQTVITMGGTTAAPGGDVVAEIQKIKTLLDQGILTEEEFAAKKRQLLGI